jgi:hypothetical protein
MSKQQTAVEWLEKMIQQHWESGTVMNHDKFIVLLKRAKQKECEQIAKAWERRAMDVTGYDYYRLYYGKLPIGGEHE